MLETVTALPHFPDCVEGVVRVRDTVVPAVDLQRYLWGTTHQGDPASQRAALEVSEEILRMCIREGGTISGEHGVGIEKRSMMSELFAENDLAAALTASSMPRLSSIGLAPAVTFFEPSR